MEAMKTLEKTQQNISRGTHASETSTSVTASGWHYDYAGGPRELTRFKSLGTADLATVRDAEETQRKYLRMMEEITSSAIPKERREFKAFLHRHNVRREGIIAPALIRSRNYHPIIHYDRDCWLTVVGAMDGSPGIVTRDADHPVYCFVFPNLGVDTTLRHGDVVLFNPLYYHGGTAKFDNITDAWIYSAYFSMKTGAFQWVPMG